MEGIKAPREVSRFLRRGVQDIQKKDGNGARHIETRNLLIRLMPDVTFEPLVLAGKKKRDQNGEKNDKLPLMCVPVSAGDTAGDRTKHPYVREKSWKPYE